MRSLLGLLMIAAGLVIGAYSYFPEAVEDHFGLVRLTRIMSPVSSDERLVAPLSRTFSPSSPLFVHTFSDAADPSTQTGKNTHPVAVVITGKSLVQPVQISATAPSNGMQVTPGYASTSASASTRYALIVDVQQELKRIGCYQGHIDGDWGPGSRRAMQAFIRKINASLPVEEPDPVLLTLLKSHTSATCAAGCAPGEIENASGQCTPAAVFADTTVAPLDTARLSEAAPPASRSLSGVTGFGWEPRVHVSPDTYTLPSLVAVSEAPAALPGRMAVGAPLPDEHATTDGETVVKTAAIPADDLAPGAPTVEREAVRPAATPKKRHSSAASKRSRKEARQRQLMRQAFGEGF